MRIIFTILIISGCCIHGYGQQISTENKQLYKYLMAKSKSQRKTAKYLLIGGGVAYLGGALVGINDGPSTGLSNAAPVFLSLGSCALVASIPFFVSAGSNQHKAQEMLVSFRMEKRQTPLLQGISAENLHARFEQPVRQAELPGLASCNRWKIIFRSDQITMQPT